MENFVAFIVIAGAIALGIIIGGLVQNLILVKIYTSKKALKRLMKTSRKVALKEVNWMIRALNTLEEE
jgi:hypothetical protein